MTHPNWFRDTVNGARVYRCCVCAYDSFDLDNIKSHVTSHPAIVLPDTSVERPLPVTIVIGVLTSASDWPTLSIVSSAWEAARLRSLGITTHVYWVDNGSSDSQVGNSAVYVTGHERLGANLGQSIARNHIIDYCLGIDADYLLMLDGNIEVIPHSVEALARYLHANQHVGCAGLWSGNCSDDKSHVSPQMLEFTYPRNGPGIAWTQYGMFNCKAFKDGVRFDESPVFLGPGWGFEDDDLGMQLTALAWSIYHTKHYAYYHKDKHSSLYAMDPSLAAKVYTERRNYVARKWGNNIATADYARRIVNQTMKLTRG